MILRSTRPCRHPALRPSWTVGTHLELKGLRAAGGISVLCACYGLCARTSSSIPSEMHISSQANAREQESMRLGFPAMMASVQLALLPLVFAFRKSANIPRLSPLSRTPRT